ncbi:MAG TPA: M20/M25/M40 family metallo-hydrolase [Candidatus Binatia bacterium]|nr:M20/M25/M40 family metallo-hydrolase [Candidatus Binatia bacterium]
MNAGPSLPWIERVWEDSVIPALAEYIRIPARSPHYDPAWREHGHLERAVQHLHRWAATRPIKGLRAEIVGLGGRPPLLLIEVAGRDDRPVLLYGHYDKQPEMTGWLPDLGPWTPVRRGERLYGRGAGDDGYAAFCALTAIEALQREGLAHGRCVVLIEGSEESGSPDLPAYVDHLASRIGRPDLVVCLDSGCGSYEQLWLTTSLRGLVNGTLRVEVLSEGVHSGASGIVPSSFRIARALLSRLEDEDTGRIRLADLHVPIPPERLQSARAEAEARGAGIHAEYPFVPGGRPAHSDLAELVLAATWRPALEITGAAGLPAIEDAGNVLRPYTALKLSLRLPPTLDAESAARRVREVLEADPPHGARVSFTADAPSGGWNAPALAPWLQDSLQAASRAYFGKPALALGVGGTIPFMKMLANRFPSAQFVVTGVMGPGSNAHGPNEFLHLPAAVRLTACVARVLADHARAGG